MRVDYCPHCGSNDMIAFPLSKVFFCVGCAQAWHIEAAPKPANEEIISIVGDDALDRDTALFVEELIGDDIDEGVSL